MRDDIKSTGSGSTRAGANGPEKHLRGADWTGMGRTGAGSTPGRQRRVVGVGGVVELAVGVGGA